MAEVLRKLPDLATLIFAASSMLAVGFSYTLSDIVGPMRNVWAVIRALLANFVLVPLLALGIGQSIGLDEPLAVGLILVGTAAGAPFLIRLTAAADHDVALSATLLVLLLPATVLYLPFVLPAMLPGAVVSPAALALPLVASMLVPLALALLIRARAALLARRLQPIMATTSSYALVALIAVTVLVNLPVILDVTMRAILAALLLVSGAFIVGYALGGRSQERRGILGLGTAQRNVSAAAVVATQSFNHPDTLIMVIVTALVGLATLFPIATRLRQLSPAGALSASSG